MSIFLNLGYRIACGRQSNNQEDLALPRLLLSRLVTPSLQFLSHSPLSNDEQIKPKKGRNQCSNQNKKNTMTIPVIVSLKYFLIVVSLTILHRIGSPNSVASAVCELGYVDGNKLYKFSLASPLPNFPHGVLSEDGFYKVAVNETVLWFQLCDGMIFNHDPPRCVDCLDCGGPSRCGMQCSALVANNKGGYDVCTTIGRGSSTSTHVIDDQNPHKGVIVKMTSSGSKHNCSLSVSVICDSDTVKGPHSLEKLETCDYTAVLQHPSGCAKILDVQGKGWGWFGTLMIIILCLFGGYLLAGTVYRYFFLRIRGLDMIPNLDFWTRLPHRTQSFFTSLIRKFRGPTEVYRSSYSPVNF